MMTNEPIRQISDALWFPGLKPFWAGACRLFCFPYAGGSSFIYHKWSKSIDGQLEVCPVQLPGRANRMNEMPFTNVDCLVEVLSERISPFINRPFAFFGHSMGAIIAYELAQRLASTRGLEPVHLFVSGRSAPHVKSEEKLTYNLPKNRFIAEIEKLNGTPQEILQNPELLELLLPLLRADFQLVETYRASDSGALSCPITVFSGTNDEEVALGELEQWKQHTTGRFAIYVLDGDHFFISQHSQFLIATISETLIDQNIIR